MTLNKARILSSENNSSMTNNQHQTTNVNIKFPDIKKAQTRDIQLTEPAGYMDVPIYPSVSASTLTNNNQAPEQELTEKEKQLLEENTQLQNQLQTREIELTENKEQCSQALSAIDDLETKNKFLELLLQVYEDNPIKINSYLVCKSSILMDMIKLLTNCDKVELILDDNIGCTGCISKNKYTYVSKILITKDGKTEDLKYAYNSIYSQFIQHGISLKVVV